MSAWRSISSHGAHAEPRGRVSAAPFWHTPRQNRLLAALPQEDYERLLPDLEPVLLNPGWSSEGGLNRQDHLHFLTEGIVSQYCLTESGDTAEYAVTGNEGVIGIASFLGGGSMSSRTLALCAGFGYRLGADLVRREFESGSALSRELLRYTQVLISQVGQVAVCNRHHVVEQQLCRWVLSCLDRLSSNELAVTQETIALMLGVRREGISEAAGILQKEGLIHYSRGHIAVLDRHRLEARACECYSVVRHEYDRLLRPNQCPSSD